MTSWAHTRRLCLTPAAWPSSVSLLVHVTLQQAQAQGGRAARNSVPTAAAAAGAGAGAAPPLPPPKKPWDANPPALVAPSAYFSCSVTQLVCACARAIARCCAASAPQFRASFAN
jgi:predicted amidohydrolase